MSKSFKRTRIFDCICATVNSCTFQRHKGKKQIRLYQWRGKKKIRNSIGTRQTRKKVLPLNMRWQITTTHCHSSCCCCMYADNNMKPQSIFKMIEIPLTNLHVKHLHTVNECSFISLCHTTSNFEVIIHILRVKMINRNVNTTSICLRDVELFFVD